MNNNNDDGDSDDYDKADKTRNWLAVTAMPEIITVFAFVYCFFRDKIFANFIFGKYFFRDQFFFGKLLFFEEKKIYFRKILFSVKKYFL